MFGNLKIFLDIVDHCNYILESDWSEGVGLLSITAALTAFQLRIAGLQEATCSKTLLFYMYERSLQCQRLVTVSTCNWLL